MDHVYSLTQLYLIYGSTNQGVVQDGGLAFKCTSLTQPLSGFLTGIKSCRLKICYQVCT